MKSILIKNGRFIDPEQSNDRHTDIALIDGKVAWIGSGTLPKDDYEIIDASGMIVAPGFIDLHTHLRQPGFEDKETIATGTMAAARGGFTTICAMPNTNPPIENRSIVDYVKCVASSEGIVRVLPIGCISKGRKGEILAELGEMGTAGVIGFSDDGSPVPGARLMKQAMEYAAGLGLPIIDHCEEPSLAEGGQVNEGIIATRLGLAGIPNAAEETMVARDIALAKLTGARIHLCHISTKGSVDLIRNAKADSVQVTAEATPHHLTLTEERCLGYDTNSKVNPPLRTQTDIDALIAGLIDGTIEAIATDHAPHSENDKCCEFALAPFGISGLETALGSLMKLVHNGKIPLPLIIEKLTAGPARIIGDGFGATGSLTVGDPADVVIFDPKAEWTVDVSKFASKGKNTPLAGEKLKGKVIATIYHGNIVYKEDNR
ncbi:dihydroorotase [Dehalogenimonas etheniformans]|uniref:Dihydroorotase n=1 Tax=Dehalogenimonas etheniformans TaxID=1536648 RepID=A0A2P5P896_9CHLR|nr:dihydroorotase [Dehalogenimonas etheniformans]PPD58495.1 dihydroorotase [Dehalogenimonas etheniformans]QNT76741.1 dihydroorotase [Dehalogenimonas etheniformans]